MRFGWSLPATGAAAIAAAAEQWGYDVVWIDGVWIEEALTDDRTVRSATASAAALAVHTSGVRVGITAPVGHDHPIELAEEAAVADLALGGRLVLAVQPVPGTASRLPEVLDLLLECFASHPFRHEGPVWPAPANLPENVFNLEDRIRVTPPPAQLELPLWVAGTDGREAAVERALGVLAGADESPDDLAQWWAGVTARHPRLARRLRRSMFWDPPLNGDGRVDHERAIDELKARQRAADIDLVVVRSTEPSERLMIDISTHVRPRVQLDRLPPGLDEHWTEHQHHNDPCNDSCNES